MRTIRIIKMFKLKPSTFLVALSLLIASASFAAPVNILPLGDSITSDNDFAYRDELYKKLDDAGYDFKFVGSISENGSVNEPIDHEGHSGFRADKIDTSLSGWLAGYDIDIALIHLGTNDILQGLPNTDATTLTELESIIGKLQADNINASIFVAKIIPIHDNVAGSPSGADKAIDLNDSLDDIWATAQSTVTSKVRIVNQNSVIVPSTDMVAEVQGFIHPNAAGEDKMAQKWFGDLVANPIMPPKLNITSPSTLSMVDTFSITTTSKSNGAITYTPLSQNNCTVNAAGLVTPQNAGADCVITVSQAAGKNDTLSTKYASTSTSVTISITLQTQVITFATNTPTIETYKKIPSLFTVSASSTSGLAISFEPITPLVCNIDSDNNKVTILSAGIPTGICKIKATQAGDSNYAPAEKIHSITINRATQTITFNDLPDKQIGSGNVTLTATTTAEEPNTITYTTSSAACSISGSTVTLTAVGQCVIKANQAGNDKYKPAPEASQVFKITEKTPQTINFEALGDVIFGSGNITLGATGGASGNPVIFSTNSSACSVVGNTVTLKAIGTCEIKANQAGNATYNSATVVNQSFEIKPIPQVITFTAIDDKAIGSGDVTLSATGGASGNAVTFNTDSSACSVAGNTVTLKAIGTCEIKANQKGDNTYAAADESVQSFEIRKLSQAIIDVTSGKSTKTIPPSELRAIGLKNLDPNFDYTKAIKNGTYKKKSQPTIEELQKAIDNENKAEIKTAGSTSVIGLMLFGFMALYRRKKGLF